MTNRGFRLVFIAILAVFLVSFGILVATGGQEPPAPANPEPILQPKTEQVSSPMEAPSVLAGMDRTSLLKGEDAIKSISELHGVTIELADAYVAEYASADGTATVWASMAADREAATDLMTEMNLKMEGSTVFSPPQSFVAGETEIFMTQGMGADHFYFQRGQYVFWVALQGSGAMDVLHDLVRIAGMEG